MKSLTFDEFWYLLNKKKRIDSSVEMTPDQFKHMLQQAYDCGFKKGSEDHSEDHSEGLFNNLFRGFK